MRVAGCHGCKIQRFCIPCLTCHVASVFVPVLQFEKLWDDLCSITPSPVGHPASTFSLDARLNDAVGQGKGGAKRSRQFDEENSF